MPRIFIIGLTSTNLGAMESGGNLGNYTIIEPIIENIKREFPNSEIVTSIQMSDSFCSKFGILCKKDKRFWTYGLTTAKETILDMFRLIFWKLLKFQGFLKNSKLLTEINKSDLVIDFSGDLFGDNASPNQFLEGCTEILFARVLKKPVVLFAGSPGPFKRYWRRFLAKFVLNNVSLIINREPLSTELLLRLGIKPSIIKTTACPSFLFEGKSKDKVKPILEKENISIDGKTPLVGVIISGWNMLKPPYNKVPRDEEELLPFIPMLKYLLDEIHAQVVLISHSNRIDKSGNLRHGPDYIILSQIYQMLNGDKYKGRLLKLKGVYDVATIKGILGCFDMVISGRTHAAVSSLTQGVPTVFIDYGHEPKAHKVKGFARLCGLESYVCDPRDPEGMLKTVSEMWKNRIKMRQYIIKRIRAVKRLVKLSFSFLHELIEVGNRNDREN